MIDEKKDTETKKTVINTIILLQLQSQKYIIILKKKPTYCS